MRIRVHNKNTLFVIIVSFMFYNKTQKVVIRLGNFCYKTNQKTCELQMAAGGHKILLRTQECC